MIASAPIALLGTFGLLLSDQVAGTTAASYLLLILFYLYAILSGFYVVSTPARSRYATPAAIMLFTLLSLGCIAMVVGPFTEGTGSDAPAAYYIILALLIASGIATTTYYATSSKVRRVFNK